MSDTGHANTKPEHRQLIDGRLVSARRGAMFSNLNPATEEVIGEVADGGPQKANLLKESGNQFWLEVDRRANKVEIRRAVETLFKTEVVEVKTLNVMGKTRRMGKSVGRRSDWKKAIVRLAPGKRIEFFEGA